MPTPQIPKVSSTATLDELRDSIIGTHRYLTYLLSALDTLNIKRLDAEVIIAESITAGKLAADSVQTENLQAGAVTAEKITVKELSAISADLGHITAGLIESIQIFGSYIATRNGTYPRAEMSDSGDLFATYFDANNYIKYVADYGGAPAIEFYTSGTLRARFSTLLGGLQVDSPNGTNHDGINRFQDWTKILNTATNRTLKDELDDINFNFSLINSSLISIDARLTAGGL
jgi:hypothetical protein